MEAVQAAHKQAARRFSRTTTSISQGLGETVAPKYGEAQKGSGQVMQGAMQAALSTPELSLALTQPTLSLFSTVLHSALAAN